MKLLRYVVALLPCVALAQGIQPGNPPALDNYPRPALWNGQRSAVALRLPLNANGAMIPDDAGTVAHVYWDGSQLRDTKGNAWTMNGTVPQVAAPGPFVPGRAGAGPFSASNYYSLPSEAFNVTTFSACAAFMVPDTSSNYIILAARDSGSTVGYGLYTGGGNGILNVYGTGGGLLSQSGVSANGHNVVCWGRQAGNLAVKVNLGTYATGTVTANGVATGVPGQIGVSQSGTAANAGQIYEVWFSTTVPSDALFTKIQQRVLGMTGTRGEPISATRSTTATYLGANGQLYTAPPGVLRIQGSPTAGALIEPGATNWALNSGDISVWSKDTGVIVTHSDAACPLGPLGTRMDGVDNTGGAATAAAWQTGGALSGASFTLSAYVAAPSGTATPTVAGACNGTTVSTCSCLRSDQGACSTTTTTDHCFAWATVGTTPVRLMASYTCDAAPNVGYPAVWGGRYGVATGKSCIAAAQQEAGLFATSYIPTTSTSASRSADQVSVATPSIPLNNWCVVGSYTRGTWSSGGSVTAGLWGFGPVASANSARPGISPGGWLYMQLWDATSAARYTTWNVTGLTSGSQHRMAGCSNLSFYGDGVKTSGSPAGPGTGLGSSLPGTFYVGAEGPSGQFGGILSDLRVCKVGQLRGDCR